ncbi:hypothetical protein GE061_017167 [Apolygus lucorum]|uniref:DUF7869 domain-containing protein n=1 Tax=Apolygus lucorum TaxID=248454 RepID=A0A6A4KB93_APOLU|nr:hypothetical protein GE061_017167 [Apolygus lucorum]
MGTGRASMHLWYEVLAGRGASEISSCLMKYIELNFRPLADDEERKLIIWSDRCVGQNNNWTLLNTCCYLVQSRYFSEANQKFLVSGHSFLPCDRDFALIEKKKKTSKVYVPSQWKYVIADAKVNEPFSIVEMRQEDFKDLQEIERHLLKTKNKNLKVTKNLWMKYSIDDPFCIYARQTHNTLHPWQKHTVYTAPSRSLPQPHQLPPEHTSLLPISQAKKADLLRMVPFLEPEYRGFYESLPSIP